MTTRFFYRADSTTTIELIHGVEVTGFSLQHCAEEGTVGNGTITVNDPLGIYAFKGHRTIYATESDIPDPADSIIWRGYTARRSIKRGTSELTGAARVHTIEVVDQNSVLSRRIQVGNDAKRPAEKDTVRIPWLIETSEAGVFDDTTTYVHLDRPTSMPANDFRGQPNLGVFDDCAQQSGKNYWADYFNGVGIGVWYGHPGEPDYIASIAISNVLSDIDNDSVFGPAKDASGDWDPSRIFSGVYLSGDFKPGWVYETRPATATEYAARDTSASSMNVKTAAQARKRAKRQLEDTKDDEIRIALSLTLPSSHINRAKAGQLINCRFSHLPGFETTTALRILSRTITKLTPKWYKLDLVLSGGDVLPPPGNAAATLYFPMNREHGLDLNPDIAFDNTGDDPGPGRAYYPLVGDGLAYHELSGYEGEVWNGIEVMSDGTVDIDFRASLAAVVSTEVEAVFTIMLDGTPIATTTVAEFHDGPGFFTATQTVTASDVEVTTGQIITTKIATTGTFLGGYKSPAGVGGPDEHLTVTGTFE